MNIHMNCGASTYAAASDACAAANDVCCNIGTPTCAATSDVQMKVYCAPTCATTGLWRNREALTCAACDVCINCGASTCAAVSDLPRIGELLPALLQMMSDVQYLAFVELLPVLLKAMGVGTVELLSVLLQGTM
jgi:hypothetical protein